MPAFPALETWAKQNGLSFSSCEDLIAQPQVKQLFDREISEHMRDYGQVEQIKKYRILSNEWSQETGELTPTMKVKRRIINQKYARIVDDMYKE